MAFVEASVTTFRTCVILIIIISRVVPIENGIRKTVRRFAQTLETVGRLQSKLHLTLTFHQVSVGGAGFADVLACPDLTTHKGHGVFYCGYGNSQRCEVDSDRNTFTLPIGLFADFRNVTFDLISSAFFPASSATSKSSAFSASPSSSISPSLSPTSNFDLNSKPTNLAADSKTPDNGTYKHSSRRSVGIEAGIGAVIGGIFVVVLTAVTILLFRERHLRKHLAKDLREKIEETKIREGKIEETHTGITTLFQLCKKLCSNNRRLQSPVSTTKSGIRRGRFDYSTPSFRGSFVTIQKKG